MISFITTMLFILLTSILSFNHKKKLQDITFTYSLYAIIEGLNKISEFNSFNFLLLEDISLFKKKDGSIEQYRFTKFGIVKTTGSHLKSVETILSKEITEKDILIQRSKLASLDGLSISQNLLSIASKIDTTHRFNRVKLLGTLEVLITGLYSFGLISFITIGNYVGRHATLDFIFIVLVLLFIFLNVLSFLNLERLSSVVKIQVIEEMLRSILTDQSFSLLIKEQQSYLKRNYILKRVVGLIFILVSSYLYIL